MTTTTTGAKVEFTVPLIWYSKLPGESQQGVPFCLRRWRRT